MKLYFMKDDALTYFKNNIDSNLQNYLTKDNLWIYEKYKDYKKDNISPFMEFKFEVPEFKLEIPDIKLEDSDYNNTKILYISLKDISDTQASDERFWVGLAHSHLWEYMQYRCRLNESTIKSKKILNNYFFNYANRRNLIIHPLARMWWVGRLIYDENNAKDHFEGLEYLKNDFAGKTLTMFSNNYTNNPTIVRAILKSIVHLEKSNEKINILKFREILRYINLLSGIIILDYLSEEELIEKIIKHYFDIYK